MNRIPPIIKITIAAAALIFMAADIVHNFREDDPIHYFARNPGQWFWVAAISIGGALIALVFSRSSPQSQRYMKLFALGAAATGLTAFTVSALRLSVQISRFAGISNFSASDYIVPVGLVVATSLLWFLFYQTVKKPIG